MTATSIGTAWQISGDYCETCNCLYICSCTPSNFALPPNQGDCKFALAFRIDQGRFGTTPLNDLTVVLVGRTPEGPMIAVNWSVGLLIDERADQAQQEALTAIFSGNAGGPMANLAPLIADFLGVEVGPIRYQQDGLTRSVSIPDTFDHAVEGFASPVKEGEYLYIESTGHPANSRLAVARATRSHLHAFGLEWDDDSGRTNGHFAPFDWSGTAGD